MGYRYIPASPRDTGTVARFVGITVRQGLPLAPGGALPVVTAKIRGETRVDLLRQPAPLHLQQAEVVSKGDQVVISAASASINVRMPGEALANGAPGEQIRVRNLSSSRVIRARVKAPGQVQVDM